MTTTPQVPDARPTIEDVCADYLNHLRHERGAAKTTVYTYSSWLHAFRKWLGDNGHPAATLTAFTTTNLRSYQYSLSARKLRPRSIRAAFHPLSGLGEFLVTHRVIQENPCKTLTLPKKDAAIRLTISDEEIAALLAAVERLHPLRRASMARAMLHVFVYTGMRFQEVLDLRMGDVSLDAGTVLIACGKGSKSRMLYPPAPCMDALRRWLDVRETDCRHEWVWAESRGRRIGDMGVRDLLEEVKAAAGLRGRDNIKPHGLRHAFATRMMANGASLKTIQSSLGHQAITTTAIYCHASEQETRKMAQFAALQAPTDTARDTRRAEPAEERSPRRVAFQQSRRAGPTRTARK